MFRNNNPATSKDMLNKNRSPTALFFEYQSRKILRILNTAVAEKKKFFFQVGFQKICNKNNLQSQFLQNLQEKYKKVDFNSKKRIIFLN